jgi:homoserine O-acetyltransferase
MTGDALNLINDTLVLPEPLALDGGQSLPRVEVAYETIGTLNADKSNAILLFHALTMDQHVVSTHPRTGKPGWWSKSVGPGKVIDTSRYYVICANVLGGCMGSTGPASLADDGKPWAMRFPVITIRDMVRAQVALLDVLGIEQVHAVIGGSMGGMQALSFAANWPDRTRAVLVIASAPRGTRPRTSPFMRLAVRRSWPIPSGRVGTIRRARARTMASPSRGWRRTSPICPKRA